MRSGSCAFSVPRRLSSASTRARVSACTRGLPRSTSETVARDTPTACAMSVTVTARWPARMQQLGDGPLTVLCSNRPMILDGGHNLGRYWPNARVWVE